MYQTNHFLSRRGFCKGLTAVVANRESSISTQIKAQRDSRSKKITIVNPLDALYIGKTDRRRYDKRNSGKNKTQ